MYERSAVAVCIALAALAYGLVHRLFLGPISRIPGPKLAALTFWYEFYYDVIRPGKYEWRVQEMHKE